MAEVQNKDTRYFVDIEIKTRQIVGSGYDQKQNLDKGRQNIPKQHRLFLTKGQYNRFVERFGELH